MNNDFHIVWSAVSETEGIISESVDISSITKPDYDKDMGSIQLCSYHGRGHSGGRNICQIYLFVPKIFLKTVAVCV